MTDVIAPLSRSLHRERIERARRMSVDERLSEGGRLFVYACSITLSGIRSQYPGISESHAMDELRRRLGVSERRERRQTARYRGERA
jgi:hypothetical protein